MGAGKSIVLASGNQGKLKEFMQLLAPYKIDVRPQSEFIALGANETGTTFRENALLKARYASQVAKLPAIADDSGIEVDALLGAPGVYSARFAGPAATDAENNRKLLAVLDSVIEAKRTARFRCVLAYVRNAEDVQPLVAEGTWEGHILRHPRGAQGFGYDSLFLPTDSALTAAELTAEIKNQCSHRGAALRELLRLLLANNQLSS